MPSHSPMEPNEFEDLENRLRRLSPAPLRADFSHRLGRELDSLSQNREESRIVWMRFAPLAAAACLVLTGAWLIQRQLTTQLVSQPEAAAVANAGDTPTVAPSSDTGRLFVSPPPISSGIPADRFVPVSSQQHLRQALPGDVVEMPQSIPAREMKLEYDDSWHWLDPETQTNVRVFRPREEVVLVPIETD